MGQRGPLATPDNVRALRGNPGKRQSPKTLKMRPGAPEMPADLDARAADEWRRVVPELDAKGLLSSADLATVVAYCRAVSVADEAYDNLLRTGLAAPDRDGAERKSPFWQIWREATTLATVLAKELFVTPASRLRTTVPEAEDADAEKASSILD